MPTDCAVPMPEPLPETSARLPVALLLATDFDGTISPIVSDPAAAQMDPIVRSLLAGASSDPRIAVAFISGRDPQDLLQRTIGVRAFIAGSHGLECLDPGGRRLWSPRHPFPEPEGSLLEDVLRSGLRIERKTYSLAVHFRNAAHEEHHDVLERFVAWARAAGLDVIPGRKVVEARLRGGGKRAALRAIARYVRAKRVVFAGDDTTDFPALAFASGRGRAIFVESSERSAPDIHPLDRVTGLEALCHTFEEEIAAVVQRNGRRPEEAEPDGSARTVGVV